MIFENLDKKLRSLEGEIKRDLIDAIKEKGHEGSGKLIASINVDIKESGGKYEIEIDCFEYIKFLDHGKFLEDFLIKQTDKLLKIISKEAQKDLENILNKLK